MCVDYSDLNKVCPKDSYHLPSIDRLVDRASSFQILNFLDAYSDYNQIRMYPSNTNKTAFMMDGPNYYYQVMSFGVKIVGATYQRLINKVFADHINHNLEVYVDNMVVKSTSSEGHIKDLEEIFAQVRRHNMRLNPDKCLFGVQGRKFLGFMLTHTGIEVNLDKCEAIIKMKSPQRWLASLSRFLPRVAEKARPFFQLLKKSTSCHWNDDCEKAFQDFKQFLASPPVLTRPMDDQDLCLHLVVSKHSISIVVVQEAIKDTKSCILHQQDTTKHIILISDDRKVHLPFGHLCLMATSLFPLSYNGSPNRPPYPIGATKTLSVELFEFALKFEPRGAIKSQVLAYFLVKMTSPLAKDLWWVLYMDGSSNPKGGGASIILEGLEDITMEHLLKFDFKASNNQGEYEALLARFDLA
ncbi:Retrovirus-related Pol polyprotein from transposon 17.6, partial [Mucuna pruriens]